MKKIVFLTALLASSGALAQTPSSGSTANESGLDPNETVCRRVTDTGSRLGHARVCMTRAQWAEQRRTTRETVDRAQSTRVRQY
jgi:hypothetical protein